MRIFESIVEHINGKGTIGMLKDISLEGKKRINVQIWFEF